jgi:DEAD/DEAH box helicase domain-containing protein
MAYPARSVSLRSGGSERVTIQAETPANGWSGEVGEDVSVSVIGEIDHASAPFLLHEGAIYLHEGQSHLVTALDLPGSLAHVRPLEVDYYTEVVADAAIDVLAEHERRAHSGSTASFGDLRVSTQVTGYRRIKRFTHETLGVFPLDYPPQELETSGYWLTVASETQAALERAGNWYDSVNDYGPNWEEQRQRVRAREGYRCKYCGAAEPPGRQHDVHHLIPFRTFGYVRGVNEQYLEANRLGNLILVCRACHQRLESAVRTRSGMDGLAYALTNLAPLYLMCDPQDIGVHVERAKTLHGDAARAGEILPTIYIYERIAAGLGFSARLFELHATLLAAAHDLIRHCACPQGCPACVGPVLDATVGMMDTKRLALALLAALTGGEAPQPALPVGVLEDVEFGM